MEILSKSSFFFAYVKKNVYLCTQNLRADNKRDKKKPQIWIGIYG